MYRKWLLLAGVMDLFILSVLDKIAYQYYLYWRFSWFDIVMHLIGGISIGLISSYVYWLWQREKFSNDNEDLSPIKDRKFFFILNLGFILIAGIGWEIFEILFDRIVQFDLLNIFWDLIFGIIGSLLAGLFVLWIHNHKLKTLK